jgi:hypothetical protein
MEISARNGKAVAIRGLTRRTRGHGENQTKVNLIRTEFGRS